jgi:hypothetical protein
LQVDDPVLGVHSDANQLLVRHGNRISALKRLAFIHKSTARQKRAQEQGAVSMLGQEGVDLGFPQTVRGELSCCPFTYLLQGLSGSSATG